MKNLIALAFVAAVVYAEKHEEKKEEEDATTAADAKPKDKAACLADSEACLAGNFDDEGKAVAEHEDCKDSTIADGTIAAAWDCSVCGDKDTSKCGDKIAATETMIKGCPALADITGMTVAKCNEVVATSTTAVAAATKGCTDAKAECDKAAGATTLAAGLLLATAAILY